MWTHKYRQSSQAVPHPEDLTQQTGRWLGLLQLFDSCLSSQHWRVLVGAKMPTILRKNTSAMNFFIGLASLVQPANTKLNFMSNSLTSTHARHHAAKLTFQENYSWVVWSPFGGELVPLTSVCPGWLGPLCCWGVSIVPLVGNNWELASSHWQVRTKSSFLGSHLQIR